MILEPLMFSPREWMEFCSQQLVTALTANETLRRVTDNPDLIGAYAECSIREFIRRFVFPLKLSVGSIVYEGNAGGKIPQLDGIIWHPSPLPPLVEAGEFALVPRSAGLAYLEIKRSNYSAIGEKIKEVLSLENDLVPTWEGLEPVGDRSIQRALGVVCLFTATQSDKPLADLIAQKRVVVILKRENEKAEYMADAEGIILLANFLMNIRNRAKLLDGGIKLNLPPPSPPQSSTLSGEPLPAPPTQSAPSTTSGASPIPSGVR